jgi:hypothetical protein
MWERTCNDSGHPLSNQTQSAPCQPIALLLVVPQKAITAQSCQSIDKYEGCEGCEVANTHIGQLSCICGNLRLCRSEPLPKASSSPILSISCHSPSYFILMSFVEHWWNISFPSRTASRRFCAMVSRLSYAKRRVKSSEPRVPSPLLQPVNPTQVSVCENVL